MMKVEEIREKAKQIGIKPGKMKKADLIKAIQRSEGNIECFNSGAAPTCGQESCLWRDEC